MPGNCKVIATCFAGREVREHPEQCGDPPGPFTHAQNFPDAGSVLELMKMVVDCERTVDPGVACDTIIVNNDVGWTPGNRYLAELDGSPTFAGAFKVLTRDNIGASMGGYNHAFERLGHIYDYWAFTEDDILLSGHRHLAQCISALQRPEIGFVAIQGLSRVPAQHAHGGVGVTRASVLAEVCRVWGSLPHCRRDQPQSAEAHSLWGEVLFTNVIERLGYELITVDSAEPLYTFAYHELMEREGRPVAIKPRSLLRRLVGRVAHVAQNLTEVSG
jgi:hypothetical protein